MSASEQPRTPTPLRTRLIFFPVRELRKQREGWNQLVGEPAAHWLVRAQVLLPIAVWLSVAFWVIAIGAAALALAVGDNAGARRWALLGAVCNVVIVVIGAVLTRIFATSAARVLLPAIEPIDPTATLANLTVIVRRRPTYFAALARNHPDRFPPAR